MLVGIMSDSHGDAAATATAVKILLHRGATKLFHCGDICGENVLAELAGHDCTFVWGNCDQPTNTMRQFVATLGLTWPRRPQQTTLCDRQIALFHGHEPDFSRFPREPSPSFIFYGHTHRCSDHRENGCRLINPGALYRADVRTVALLDLESDHLSFFSIENGNEIHL